MEKGESWISQMVLQSKSMPVPSLPLPSSKPSSVLLWAAWGFFPLRHLDQLFPRSCLCADNFQEFASLWNLVCMWPVTNREVFFCCIHTARTNPKFMGSMNAMAVLPSFTTQSSASWEGLTQGERRYTLFLCTYLERLKNQLRNFGTRSCR